MVAICADYSGQVCKVGPLSSNQPSLQRMPGFAGAQIPSSTEEVREE